MPLHAVLPLHLRPRLPPNLPSPRSLPPEPGRSDLAAHLQLFSQALESDPGCIVAWDLAIWNEAADAQWEAAAALAHVAVAVNYTSATLWQQWQRLEGLRENTEAQLRLRALASAAGVRTLTEGASTADSHVPG
uniref:Uncharacterized protein n=1 Tax=Emiliania huxleyi TaxID=2903 RepID=A0A7S3W2T7_EMIHU